MTGNKSNNDGVGYGAVVVEHRTYPLDPVNRDRYWVDPPTGYVACKDCETVVAHSVVDHERLHATLGKAVIQTAWYRPEHGADILKRPTPAWISKPVP